MLCSIRGLTPLSLTQLHHTQQYGSPIYRPTNTCIAHSNLKQLNSNSKQHSKTRYNIGYTHNCTHTCSHTCQALLEYWNSVVCYYPIMECDQLLFSLTVDILSFDFGKLQLWTVHMWMCVYMHVCTWMEWVWVGGGLVNDLWDERVNGEGFNE